MITKKWIVLISLDDYRKKYIYIFPLSNYNSPFSIHSYYPLITNFFLPPMFSFFFPLDKFIHLLFIHEEGGCMSAKCHPCIRKVHAWVLSVTHALGKCMHECQVSLMHKWHPPLWIITLTALIDLIALNRSLALIAIIALLVIIVFVDLIAF